MEEIQVFIIEIRTIKKPSPSSPTVLERHGCALARAATVLAGIRAGGINRHRLPKRVFKTLSGCDGSGALRRVHLPLRGQRRLAQPNGTSTSSVRVPERFVPIINTMFILVENYVKPLDP
jgi:hypothetical protein